MFKRNIELYIVDILESSKKIKKFIKGLTFDDFKKDEKTLDAVIRNLEVIGEAAYHLPADFKKKHSYIPWLDISDMRNKLIHEYFGVDSEILWKTINEDLPSLVTEIKNIVQ